MEISINIENYQEGETQHDINSPRTMEACLRAGCDPSELYARKRGDFAERGLTKEMIKVKYTYFERRRAEKIEAVRKERNAIIKFATRKSASQPNSPEKGGGGLADTSKDAAMGLVEQEEKRMEALKRRQEKELEKIMEREGAMAVLHEKIAEAEALEQKKIKEHKLAVLAAKADAEKKAKSIKQKQAAKDAEEEAMKAQMLRKEAAVQEKLIKMQMEEKKRIEKEARAADMARKAKMEEYKRQTEALLKQQAEEAERNRIIMVEREHRVQELLKEKKAKKAADVAASRAAAKVRIDAALAKHHDMAEQKKKAFDEAQATAEALLLEKQKADVIRQREQLEEREKNNVKRYNRLVQSHQKRAEHTAAIVEHMQSKDGGYERLCEERREKIEFDKFVKDLKMREKQENVQQTLRQGEFKRLQTLNRIEEADIRYEDIQSRKKDLMRSFRQEQKRSLTRKHRISDAMELMKVTGDTKMLDRIFSEGKSKVTQKGEDDDDEKVETTKPNQAA